MFNINNKHKNNDNRKENIPDELKDLLETFSKKSVNLADSYLNKLSKSRQTNSIIMAAFICKHFLNKRLKSIDDDYSDADLYNDLDIYSAILAALSITFPLISEKHLLNLTREVEALYDKVKHDKNNGVDIYEVKYLTRLSKIFARTPYILIALLDEHALSILSPINIYGDGDPNLNNILDHYLEVVDCEFFSVKNKSIGNKNADKSIKETMDQDLDKLLSLGSSILNINKQILMFLNEKDFSAIREKYDIKNERDYAYAIAEYSLNKYLNKGIECTAEELHNKGILQDVTVSEIKKILKRILNRVYTYNRLILEALVFNVFNVLSVAASIVNYFSTMELEDFNKTQEIYLDLLKRNNLTEGLGHNCLDILSKLSKNLNIFKNEMRADRIDFSRLGTMLQNSSEEMKSIVSNILHDDITDIMLTEALLVCAFAQLLTSFSKLNSVFSYINKIPEECDFQISENSLFKSYTDAKLINKITKSVSGKELLSKTDATYEINLNALREFNDFFDAKATSLMDNLTTGSAKKSTNIAGRAKITKKLVDDFLKNVVPYFKKHSTNIYEDIITCHILPEKIYNKVANSGHRSLIVTRENGVSVSHSMHMLLPIFCFNDLINKMKNGVSRDGKTFNGIKNIVMSRILSAIFNTTV